MRISDWSSDVCSSDLCPGCSKELVPDPDTFDTWFSSGQWPFITTTYHDSGKLAEFFPNSVMETGHDILFPWVSRMIMLSLYKEQRVPFKHVYLHGLVLDPHGQKMSKSKGNVINPQEVMDAYGSDALRIGLLTSRSAGQNQAFGVDKVVAGRNFANKLWNIARYIESAVGETGKDKTPKPSTPADHWIMRELDAAANEVAAMLEEYRFSEAVETVYHTIWDKLADWYLEASKTALASSEKASVMVWALETCLKIAHPFAPFVTEAIWQTLKWDDSLLITSSWPTRVTYDKKQADQFEQLQKIIIESREVLAETGAQKVQTQTTSPLVAENSEIISRMARIESVHKVQEGSGLRLSSTNEPVWLDLSEEQIKTYKTALTKKHSEISKAKELIEKRLANSAYIANAPEELVAESKATLVQLASQAKQLEKQLDLL